MTKQVEFIYDADCPNIEVARKQLMAAFTDAGITPKWVEWERNDPKNPDYVRQYGSPTILVDGKDVAGVTPTGDSNNCRIYKDEAGVVSGVPSVKVIISALLNGVKTEKGAGSGGASKVLKVAPSFGVVALTPLICPACWPLYVGFLSSLGIWGAGTKAYLVPVTGLLVVLALVPLWPRAGNQRGYWPLAMGGVGASVVIANMLMTFSDSVLYAGALLLVAASIWNLWPQEKGVNAECPACVSAEQEGRI